jgi:hypothetical protein
MSAVDIRFGGGEKMRAYLSAISSAVGNARSVRIGFLEAARYPAEDRTERFLKGLDKLNSVGPFKPGAKPSRLKDYRKRKKAQVGPPKPDTSEGLHVAQVAFWVEFGTKTAPARPAFRNMIRSNSGDWGGDLGNYLKTTHYDAARSLGLMGTEIQDQLKDSINEWPADNAPLTVAIKGFSHGWIWHGIALRSVDYEVQS